MSPVGTRDVVVIGIITTSTILNNINIINNINNINIINNIIIMKNIIIITSSIIIAALSLNAKEINPESNENPNKGTETYVLVEAVVAQLNNSIEETLKCETRTSIGKDTEYSMKYLSEIQNLKRLQCNGYYAETAPVTFVNLSR